MNYDSGFSKAPWAVVLANAAFHEAVVEGGGVAAPPGHVARRVAHHGILVLVMILHNLLERFRRLETGLSALTSHALAPLEVLSVLFGGAHHLLPDQSCHKSQQFHTHVSHATIAASHPLNKFKQQIAIFSKFCQYKSSIENEDFISLRLMIWSNNKMHRLE